jgi:hypothetical protein
MPVLGVASLVPSLAAQRSANSFDISLGASGDVQRAAATAWLPVFAPSERVHAGMGIRATAYAGKPVVYENRDLAQGGLVSTLPIDPAVYALTVAVFGEGNLGRSVAIGANLDLAGLATGPDRSVGALRATPQVGSYFQYGHADRGALNSEFYLALRLGPRLRLRAGMSHYVTNYIVTDPSTAGDLSSRYQRFVTVPFVALSVRR